MRLSTAVRVGIAVIHKAFGYDQIKGGDGDLIVVIFNGTDKKFQPSRAFEQELLKLEELQ